MAPSGIAELEPEQIVRLEEDGPGVVLLDQRRLPEEVVEVRCTTAAEVADAITEMVVRGAPAIGIAAAYGLALAALRGDDLAAAEATLAASRPTAVNLPWALAQMREEPTPARARALHEEEVRRCRRIAAHGDTATKIGTYSLAVLAAHHEIPFYVVAPTSTLDRGTPDGSSIPIEERDPAELTSRFPARNPAFDVTPAALIAAIITEDGVHRAPYEDSLR